MRDIRLFVFVLRLINIKGETVRQVDRIATCYVYTFGAVNRSVIVIGRRHINVSSIKLTVSRH